MTDIIKLAAFTKADYIAAMQDINHAGPAPYDANSITTALMLTLDKSVEAGIFSREQSDYLFERMALETGIIDRFMKVVNEATVDIVQNRAAPAPYHARMDEMLASETDRINAFNEGGIDAIRGIKVLYVDEDTTEDEFREVFEPLTITQVAIDDAKNVSEGTTEEKTNDVA